MTEFWCKREGDALFPADDESVEEMSRIPRGVLVHVTVRQPRNGRQHRLWWLLVHRIADAVGCDPEVLADHIKVRVGHVRTVHTPGGTYHYPASISFAAMDQTEFDRFFSRCVDVIVTDWGIKRPDVLAQVAELLEPKTEMRG